MKTVAHTIELGGADSELWMEASIDGRVVVNRKGDSLTAAFLGALYSHMNGGAQDPNVWVHRGNSGGAFNSNNRSINAIDSVVGEPVKIWVRDLYNYQDNGNKIQLMGIKGRTDLNGLKILVYANESRYNPLGFNDYAYTISGSVGNATVPSLDVASQVRPRWYNNGPYRNYWCFSRPDILLGRSDAPTRMSHVCLDNEVTYGTGSNQLVWGNVIVSQPAIGDFHSEIALTRDFTNNSGAPVVVREAGLYMRESNPDERYYSNNFLAARDPVDITVPSGSTMTFSYRIRTSVNPNGSGGILITFNEMLFRQIAETYREAKDVDNSNKSRNQNTTQFLAVPWAADAAPNGGRKGEWIGPQVGTSGTQVAVSDFRLTNNLGEDTRIPHGIPTPGNPKLLQYPGVTSPFTYDDNTAQFSITKLFENRSTTETVQVTEIGFYIGRDASNDFLRAYDDVHCISRNALSLDQQIGPGDILRVTYTFKLVL